ncbi:hypothetical protein ACHAWF_012094 [Thalassiosira exigua]
MTSPASAAPAVAPPPSTAPPSPRGIDLRDALSILAARSEAGDGHGRHRGEHVPSALKDMGQTIDLNATTTANEERRDGAVASSKKYDGERRAEETRDALRRARERRNRELDERLSSMDLGELLRVVFEAQEERVATYRTYEEGLAAVLSSGNLASYPALCASVTASFSVLSDAANAVRSTLEGRRDRGDDGCGDAAKAVGRLQKAEGEKLNFTAAAHLERLRLANAAFDDGSDDDGTVRLLEEGIRSLRGKIARTAEEVNEALEELRCVAADEGG